MIAPIISVQDIDKSIIYYTEKLQFKLDWCLKDENEASTFASVTLGDASILLGVLGFIEEEAQPYLGSGVQLYIALGAGMNIDALYNYAVSQGATVTMEIADREWGDRAFTVNDLDGYNLMFAQDVAG